MPTLILVIRSLHILLTALLVATHVVAVPVYITLDNCRGLFQQNLHGCILDQHEDDACEVACASEQAQERSGGEEIFSAANGCAPHHHEVCAYSASNHEFSPTRSGTPQVLSLALIPDQPALELAACGVLSIPVANAPPSTAAHLRVPTLRGPPVC